MEIRRLEAELAAVEDRNRFLEEDIARIAGTADFRAKLGVIKAELSGQPGEQQHHQQGQQQHGDQEEFVQAFEAQGLGKKPKETASLFSGFFFFYAPLHIS